jgi:hypothetical protein
MPFYTEIRAAAAAHTGAAGAWEAVHAAEELGNFTAAGAGIQDMNFMYGQSLGAINASNALMASDPGAAIDSTMWAWAPWADLTSEAFGNPQYLIQFSFEGLTPEGDPFTGGMVFDPEGNIDLSTGDLLNQLQEYAQQNIDQYSSERLAEIGIPAASRVMNVTAAYLLRF